MLFPIALQLFTIRDEMEKDFFGSLRKVKALGYDGVEFASLLGHKAAEIKSQLKEIDLIPLSAHISYDELIADPIGVIKEYAEIGCKYIAIPYLTPQYRPNAEKFNEFIEGVGIIGKTAAQYGVTLLYHNHDFEFEKINSEYSLDLLYKSVPSNLLQTEIDTCWVNVAGENPSNYILKYAGRSPVVHLKDFVMPGKKPEKMYDLIGIEDDKEAPEASVFEFRPLGLGVQNIPEILKACSKSGVKWVVVEQDSPSLGNSPMECAEISLKYLKKL